MTLAAASALPAAATGATVAAAPAPPPGAGDAGGADGVGGRRRAARAGAGGSGLFGGVGGPPLLAVWGVDYAMNRLYDATLGPWLRQATNAIMGEPYTRPYIKPTTPGFLARDVTGGLIGFFLANSVMNALLDAPAKLARAGGNAGLAAKAGALLRIDKAGIIRGMVTPGGLAGVNAAEATARSVSSAAAAAAFRAMVGRTLVMSLVGTALDQLMARKLGPAVEGAVNGAFGIRQTTEVKDVRGGVPLNTVKQTFEQAARQWSRSFVGGLVYTIVWKEAGMVAARSIIGSVGGPMGGILGAVGGMVLTSAIAHVVMGSFSVPVMNMTQAAVRAVKRALGRPLDAGRPKDVISTMGDRIGGNMRGVVVPLGTALVTGQLDAYTGALASVSAGARR